jgi:predicted nuclease of restriction endonuclease-like (RecB) superfamily
LLAEKENYTLRELRRQIKSGLYERQKLSQGLILPGGHPKSDILPQVFRDKYIFEFLDLPEPYLEADLKKALIAKLRHFILELGKDFIFIAEEFRLKVGMRDFYIDLLFYHRELQCLVAFELKIEEFEPEHLGKLDFYLEALDRDVKKLHENPSIGVLLCKTKDRSVVEYAMSRNISASLISEYETKLINKKTLQRMLQEWSENIESYTDES